MADQTLEILIKLLGDLQGGRDATASINELKAATDKAGGANKAFEGASKSLEAQLAEQGEASQQAFKTLLAEVPGGSLLGKLFSGEGAAAAAGVTALALAVKEFAQAQEQVARLDAALAQNGLFTDSIREKYQALAAQLQETTGVADEQWLGVLTRLTQFGSKPESIGMDVDAVKNLAGLLGGDVQQAVQLYSRALQGNFEMFGRYGIRVEEAGTQTERLQKLQEQLAQRGGGQLEAINQTLIGQYRSLKNNVSDLFEAIGGGINQTGVLSGIMAGLGNAAAYWAKELGGTIPALKGMENAAGDAKQSLDEIAAGKTFVEKLKTDADLAAGALDKLIEKNRQLMTDEIATLDAQQGLALAQAKKKFQNDPEAAAKAEVEIREKFTKAKEDATSRAKEKDKAAIIAENNRLADERNAAGIAATQAKERADDAARIEKRQAMIVKANKELEEQKNLRDYKPDPEDVARAAMAGMPNWGSELAKKQAAAPEAIKSLEAMIQRLEKDSLAARQAAAEKYRGQPLGSADEEGKAAADAAEIAKSKGVAAADPKLGIPAGAERLKNIQREIDARQENLELIRETRRLLNELEIDKARQKAVEDKQKIQQQNENNRRRDQSSVTPGTAAPTMDSVAAEIFSLNQDYQAEINRLAGIILTVKKQNQNAARVV